MPGPGRMLEDWIAGFMEYTDNTEPPYLFRKWTAISCIAAALQRKVRCEWGTSLTFYPNLYIVLVGPSATGKGTAMNPGLSIISEIPAIRLSAQATSLQALIRHLKDTNLTDINLETSEQQFHSSLTIFSKEFTVFLGYHNRELMAALCDWYDCDRRWVYETISRKREEINGVWVNLIAGTTPDLIRSSLPIESIGGGLTSRIIFVFEEKQAKLVTMPTETPRERELFQALVHDLEKISLTTGKFTWTDGFIKAWDKWCQHAVHNPPFYDSKFDGYNGRRRVHLMKLSMIHSVARGRNQMQMDESNLSEAIATLTEVENKMGLVFKGVGKSDIADIVHRATAFLTTSKSNTIPISMFMRHFENDMDKFMLDRVISTLEVSRLIKILHKPGCEDNILVLEKVS
jgi:hypothetical protein